jgi:hypothetical protein
MSWFRDRPIRIANRALALQDVFDFSLDRCPGQADTSIVFRGFRIRRWNSAVTSHFSMRVRFCFRLSAVIIFVFDLGGGGAYNP